MSIETTLNKPTAKDHTESSEAGGKSPLDSLLSPKGPTFEPPKEASRESVAGSDSELNEVRLDDDSEFSSVPLSARESTASVGSKGSHTSFKSTATHVGNEKEVGHEKENGIEKEERRQTSTSLVPSDSSTLAKPASSHKKSASNSSIKSFVGNTPFILARIESQREQDESDSKVQRASIDGQQKLQEEFAKMQKVKEEEASEAVAGAIDWDFWGAVISDYQGFASENPERLARAIESGIPDTLRGMMWQLMAAAKDPELEATYLNLLKETSPHEKMITRDLGRTFPHHEFFTDGQGVGQENLFNVLKAYSLFDPDVGYCQGLPFIVAILLLNMPDEEAFSLLVRLMYSYDLRGQFLPEMPKLQLRLFQFDRLIEELLPVLHIHFLRQGVKSSMFCSQWFLTLFSYRFPLDIAFRIYDNCLASGIEAIFGFSIVLLQKNEDILLKLKMDEILAFMKTSVFDKYKIEGTEEAAMEGSKGDAYRGDKFVQDAVNLRITPFMLDSYAREYEELVRLRDAHSLEVDTLRNSNRNLAAQVKSLEDSLAQMNTEHVEVLNELVKARLRNEETEGELVRYKLLYAEAMHKNDEATHTRLSSASRKGSGLLSSFMS